MIFFSLPNLTAKQATRIPWDGCPDVVPLKFASKDDYRAWCKDHRTDHHFLSFVEGEIPGVRVSAGNPPRWIHGLIGEFDAKLPENWAIRVAEQSPAGLRPVYGCRTFSGHGRLFWPFEKPIGWANERLHSEICRIAFVELKAKRLLAGFEEKESAAWSEYFELGHDWVAIPGAQPIPTITTESWLFHVTNKFDWSREGKSVPIAKLREEGERRFPGRWPGGWDKFDLGARGIRFWDPNADAAAVLVRETGCVCFTGDKPFVPWTDIFGADFVRCTSDGIIGEAITGIYYVASSSKYWRKVDVGGWQPWSKEDIRLRLAARGLSATPARGEQLSEVDRALITIQDLRTIDGSFPALFRPEEIVTINGLRLLNTSRVQLIKPDPEPNFGGDNFPWIKKFLQQLFRKQLPYYTHWLAHFYRSALAGRPVRGLSLFIAGPTGFGKTFLNNAIHKQIFGAAGEATPFLTHKDQFNANLFACPIWTVDDAIASTNESDRNCFSQVVKAITANDEFTMRGMYREGIKVPWLGRLIVTMNDDPESLQMLPSTEINLLDKIMLLRAHMTDLDPFPSDEEVAAELPHLCAWLRDMPLDPAIWIKGRFGIKAYHDPDLLQAAEDSQATTSAKELIAQWAQVYFGPEGAGANATEWQGNPTNLISEFSRSEATRELAAKLMPTAVQAGKFLNKLINRGEPWLAYHRTANERTYVIKQEVSQLPANDRTMTEKIS